MDITISRDVLKKAAEGIHPFAAARASSLPQLQYIHFDAGQDDLHISATDLESQARIRVLVESVRETGACLIPAAQLRLALSKGRGDALRIRSERQEHKDKILLEFDGGSMQIESAAPDDFPNIFRDAPDEAHSFVMPAAMLAVLAETAAPFVSTDDLRASMMGIYFSYGAAPHALEIAATDGHRLLRLRQPAEFGDAPFEAILPAPIVKRAAELFAGDVRVKVAPAGDWIWMEDDFHQLQGRLISERYCNYNAVIPTDGTKTLEADREQLKRALEFTMICANQNTTTFALDLNEKTGAQMQVENFDAGTFSRETVYHSAFEGDPLLIGFNGRLFGSILNAIEEKTVTVKFSTPVRASVWETRIGGFDALFLLMPIRLSSEVVTVSRGQMPMGRAARELAAAGKQNAPEETAPSDVSEGNDAVSCPVAENAALTVEP